MYPSQLPWIQYPSNELRPDLINHFCPCVVKKMMFIFNQIFFKLATRRDIKSQWSSNFSWDRTAGFAVKCPWAPKNFLIFVMQKPVLNLSSVTVVSTVPPKLVPVVKQNGQFQFSVSPSVLWYCKNKIFDMKTSKISPHALRKFVIFSKKTGISRCRSQYIVSVESLSSVSSQYLSVIYYLFPVMIHWWVRKPSCGPNSWGHGWDPILMV